MVHVVGHRPARPKEPYEHHLIVGADLIGTQSVLKNIRSSFFNLFGDLIPIDEHLVFIIKFFISFF